MNCRRAAPRYVHPPRRLSDRDVGAVVHHVSGHRRKTTSAKFRQHAAFIAHGLGGRSVVEQLSEGLQVVH
jgi:hypothetical protein